MNYSGLYSPFRLNRPLSEEDIKYHLRKDFSGMGTPGSVALDDTVVIEMNSTYLELVDKYYSDRGMPDLFMLILFLAFLSGAVGVAYLILFNPTSIPNSFSRSFIGFFIYIAFLSMAIFFYRVLRKSWFTWTHYPVRFNRKTKMVHVFKLDGTILSIPWQDVFFTRGRAGPGARSEWSIDGHILDDDRKMVTDTFSLGFSTTRRELVKNWAFVRSYMEVDDCLNELADIIILCPPVARKKESYLFGMQYMMRVESRLEWGFMVILFPLIFLGSVARFIAMRTSKIPRWSKEVEKECEIAPDDPVNVSAANNPEHLWRYVLANQSLDEYNAQYQRQALAVDRLREKVRAVHTDKSC